MALFKVNRPPRDFAIGDTWAEMYPSVFAKPIEEPGDCIVCGAKGNSCKGEHHYGRSTDEEAAAARAGIYEPPAAA